MLVAGGGVGMTKVMCGGYFRLGWVWFGGQASEGGREVKEEKEIKEK